MKFYKGRKYAILTAGLALFTALAVFAVNTGATSAINTGGQTAGSQTGSRSELESSASLAQQNEKAQSAQSTAQSRPDPNEIRLELLEDAVSPKNPLEAAQIWARAAETRNGALRYAVLSPELRKKQYGDYFELNWVTGNSSPWVKSYQITEKSKEKNNTYTYKIDYSLTDSTAEIYKTSEEITIQKTEQDRLEKWVVVSGKSSEYFEPAFPQ